MAFYKSQKITKVDRTFSEVVPEIKCRWDKTQLGITVKKLLVSSGSFDANLTAAGVTCPTAAGLLQEKRPAGERNQVCLPSLLLSPPLRYRIGNLRKDK